MKAILLFGALALVVAWGQVSKDQLVPEPVVHQGAGTGIYVPAGDVAAGRKAFGDLRCHTCHRVEGHSFPDPVATPDVPVILGHAQAGQSAAELLESIIAPSCKIPADLPDVKSGKLSRMGDYRSAMTVEQLLDLVSFIRSLGEKPPVLPGPTGYAE